jgi:hypothetical protein
MAVTLFFTLHPLRSLRASAQAAKKGDPPRADSTGADPPDAPIPRGNTAISSTEPGRGERVNVQSASRARVDPPAPASEQAALAARLRVDV